jgi:2-oxoisovalerate dehydrogenase E1 component alpha subunit
LNSEFTSTLDFLQPSTHKAIPTYRVLNQYGEILDKKTGVETEDEEAIALYKNMVRRMSYIQPKPGKHALK